MPTRHTLKIDAKFLHDVSLLEDMIAPVIFDPTIVTTMSEQSPGPSEPPKPSPPDTTAH